MKQLTFTMLFALVFGLSINAQIFEEEIDLPPGHITDEILMPPSPLTTQVLFVGGYDRVQATPTYGYEAGEVYAKEWHDFIGFTPDDSGESLGWVSVNHEERYRNDRLGDGGGMTAFRVDYDENGELVVLDQTLSDGRSGKFFNVDFVNTVGETGMNCGGIIGPNGRIWTAEEWFVDDADEYLGSSARLDQSSYPTAPGPSQGIRKRDSVTLETDIEAFNGIEVAAYQTINYMVEIDPKEAVAVRKQYNWGRQGFEGGAVSNDEKYVYLGEDATPGWFTRFEADTPGDFTKGTTSVYKHDNPEGQRWVEVDNTDPAAMLNFKETAVAAQATMYNRNEWVTIDRQSGIIYWTETGRDNPGGRWLGEWEDGAVFSDHHIARAMEQGTTPESGEYWDYYGRILKYDPATDEVSVHIEGGPYFETSPSEADYPDKHLTNPDGLSVMEINGQSFLVIQEDLNGTSFGRMPEGISNRTCELFLLDLRIEDPTVDDLIRITAVPRGAEITGAVAVTDGQRISLLVNSQHPSTGNPFPWNHSLTLAIHGFENAMVTPVIEEEDERAGFSIFPNPTTREVNFNQIVDVALYDQSGKRLLVRSGVNSLDVSDYPAGVYYIKTGDNITRKLVIQ